MCYVVLVVNFPIKRNFVNIYIITIILWCSPWALWTCGILPSSRASPLLMDAFRTPISSACRATRCRALLLSCCWCARFCCACRAPVKWLSIRLPCRPISHFPKRTSDENFCAQGATRRADWTYFPTRVPVS